MTLYHAVREQDRNRVYVWQDDGHGYLLPERQDVRNHSPDGFNWGYGGSGPAQLALALLLDCCDRYIAEVLYQDFKFKVIAAKTGDRWTITRGQIQQWVDRALVDRPDRLARAKTLEEWDQLCAMDKEDSSPDPTQTATD